MTLSRDIEDTRSKVLSIVLDETFRHLVGILPQLGRIVPLTKWEKRQCHKLERSLACHQAITNLLPRHLRSNINVPQRFFTEQPLDRHHHPQLLRADRAALQEGRLLLQAVPPDGPVDLGQPRTGGRGLRGRRPTPAHLTPHFPVREKILTRFFDFPFRF